MIATLETRPESNQLNFDRLKTTSARYYSVRVEVVDIPGEWNNTGARAKPQQAHIWMGQTHVRRPPGQALWLRRAPHRLYDFSKPDPQMIIDDTLTPQHHVSFSNRDIPHLTITWQQIVDELVLAYRQKMRPGWWVREQKQRAARG